MGAEDRRKQTPIIFSAQNVLFIPVKVFFLFKGNSQIRFSY